MVFWDESGFSLRPSVRRTWAPRGQTPLLRHRFNWDRLNAVGLIACRADGAECRLLLHWQEETVKSPGVIAVLDDLHAQVPGPVVLLWDGLPAHTSGATQEHVRGQSEWLTVHRFPGYAPELNPPEYLWSSLKGKDMANVCPDTVGQLAEALEVGRQRVGGDERLLRGFLEASSLFDFDD